MPKKAMLVGSMILLSGLVVALFSAVFRDALVLSPVFVSPSLSDVPSAVAVSLILLGTFLFGGGVVALRRSADKRRVVWQVRERLFSAYSGNPLGLSDGDSLPEVSCEVDGSGYIVSVSTASTSAERVAKAAPCVSASLVGRFSSFAVVSIEQDPSSRFVRFVLRDVSSDRSISFFDVDEMMPDRPTLLTVQDGLCLDLTAARSIIVCGCTRSGKTTGVVSLLLQVLLLGPDGRGSSVVIVDGKGAELAMSGAVSLDDDGTAHSILEAMRSFEKTRVYRQELLNELSRETGDAVKWYSDIAGMRPSYLFIDEYLSLRTVIPSKASKDDPGYSLSEFDGIVRRIATMGSSAGCFLIISVAQASVGAGGIPSLVLEACGTRILFRPSLNEGAFLWPRAELDALPVRSYGPGEAWFSCDDGEHRFPSFVRFPRLNFPVYSELRRLLEEYHRG